MKYEKKGDAQKAAQKKYDAENTVRIAGIKFNLRTERDMIEKLRSLPPARGGRGGIQGYIKDLIRADLAKEK